MFKTLLKQKLLQERENILNKRGVTKIALIEQNGEGLSDIIDHASHNLDLAYEIKIQHRDLTYLKKISKALDKLEQGTLGDCEDCGQKITEERLLARPTAELCIACKEDQELKERQQFSTFFISQSLRS